MKAETADWLEQSEMELRVGSLCLDADLYRPSLFHLQQAVEKVLKAIWVEQIEEYPPRTHDLIELATRLGGATALAVAPHHDFLLSLARVAAASQYPGVVREPYSRERATYYVRGTEQVCQELRQILS